MRLLGRRTMRLSARAATKSLGPEKSSMPHRAVPMPGSDSHVLPGIGTALCGIDDFSGPRDFVAALAESRIVRRPRSLIYLQSLKFIQTTIGGPSRGTGQEDSPASV